MKILAIGMNYAEHTRELHGEGVHNEEPVIFMKPDSAVIQKGKPFFLPDYSKRVEYETELVVRICRLGKNISQRFASRYYDAVTLGIDFTARDLQQKAREKGYPWLISKGFDGSAALGEFVPKEQFKDLQDFQSQSGIPNRRRRVRCPSDGWRLWPTEKTDGADQRASGEPFKDCHRRNRCGRYGRV